MSNILHLTPYYDPHLGGVETHVREVSQRLRQLGHRVAVICEQHEANLPLFEEKKGITIYRIPVWSYRPKLVASNFGQKLYQKIKIWTWIAQHSQILIKADIIQIHDVFWWIWPLYPLLYFKTYLTCHGWEGQYPVRLAAKIQRFYNNLAAKKTVHVGAFIQQFYFDQPAAITYGGAPDRLLGQPLPHSPVRSGAWLTNNSTVVFLGRLESVNEIGLAIRFLAKLKLALPGLKIIFVGDGSWHEAAAQIGRVTGWVKDPTQYLATADLVCASSYLSILEAQALGKLVCAFYSQPLKKAYLKTFPGAKLMLIDQNPEQLAQTVRVLSAAHLHQLTPKIKAFAQTQTWQKVVDLYLDLWGLVATTSI